jgi:hypothetical protein
MKSGKGHHNGRMEEFIQLLKSSLSDPKQGVASSTEPLSLLGMFMNQFIRETVHQETTIQLVSVM